MAELFQAFGEALDTDSLRLHASPTRIFLCGGAIRSSETDGGSARDDFLNHLDGINHPIRSAVVLAEDTLRDWHLLSEHFSDLLDLEEHIGFLSPLTVIFVESPGSIAELGAFASLDRISRNLLLVVDPVHTDPSFISHGPVLRVATQARERVLKHELHLNRAPNRGSKLSLEDLEDIVETLLECLPSKSADRIFDPRQEGHMMLLVLGVAQLFGILKESEILAVLQVIDPEATSTRLKKYLFTLCALRTLKRFEYSNEMFYVTGERAKLVTWRFEPAAKIRKAEEWLGKFRTLHLREGMKRSKAFRKWLLQQEGTS